MKKIVELHYSDQGKSYKVDIRLEYKELLLIADWYLIQEGATTNNEDIFKSELFYFSSKSELEIETIKYLEIIESEHMVVSKATHDIRDLIIASGPSPK